MFFDFFQDLEAFNKLVANFCGAIHFKRFCTGSTIVLVNLETDIGRNIIIQRQTLFAIFCMAIGKWQLATPID